MTLSNAALLEISDLSTRAESLATGDPSQRAVATVLVQRISAIKQSGVSSDEMRGRYVEALNESLAVKQIDEVRYTKVFHRYLLEGKGGMAERELRTILAGQQTPFFYSQGIAGGFLIPLEYQSTVFEAMAQTDPLLDAKVTDFVMETTPTLQPKTIQGYDLSTITAQLVSETIQQLVQSFPAISGGKVLQGNLIFRTAVQASIESEQDIPEIMNKISRAYGVAFGRSLGQYAVTGLGSSQPLGLLTALPRVSYITGSGVITLNDIMAIYFALNRYYRAQPLCSWLFSDFTYERIRKAQDAQGRPLLSIIDDRETLLGKPIYVSPSFGGGGSPISSGTIAFGDMSHWHLRCSRPTLQRSINAGISGIEFGSAMYTGRIRFDSNYLDPSAGAFPPIVTASVTA